MNSSKQTSAYINQVPTDFIIDNIDKANQILSKLKGIVWVWEGHNNTEAHIRWKWSSVKIKDYSEINLHAVLVRMYKFKPKIKRNDGPVRSNHNAVKDYLKSKKDVNNVQ